MLELSTLGQFTGTEEYYSNPLFRGIQYTDACKFISDNGAAWLITDILAVLSHEKKVMREEFVSINVRVIDGGAKIIYDDGNGNVLFTQDYPITDFPGNVKFFYTNKVLMLASEY